MNSAGFHISRLFHFRIQSRVGRQLVCRGETGDVPNLTEDDSAQQGAEQKRTDGVGQSEPFDSVIVSGFSAQLLRPDHQGYGSYRQSHAEKGHGKEWTRHCPHRSQAAEN